MDRTLLAWVRTDLSLMAGGVAFDKGARLLREDRLKAGTALIHSSHIVGISITVTSTVLIAIAIWIYLRDLRSVADMLQWRHPRIQPSLISAVLAMTLGVLITVALVVTNN